MPDQLRLPDLTFPNVEFGAKETPWDLAVLLYRGGAAARAEQVGQLIASKALGDAELDRLELVSRLHAEISAALANGNSRETAADQIKILRSLFGFADRTCRTLTTSTVAATYCAWADLLLLRTRLKKKSAKTLGPDHRCLTMRSAYNYAAIVGTLLDRALERHTRIIEMTRLKWRRQRKTAVGVQAEKQSLSDTFSFGQMLQDICDGLPIRTILSSGLPVHIKLRSGESIVRNSVKGWQADTELAKDISERHPLINLRIEAELLIFIAQTGMNATQASSLTLRRFFYVSHLDGYEVSEYKRRSSRTVLFEIFKDYKSHFERYLDWRRTLFPHSNSLFPFIRFGSRPDSRFDGDRIRAVCRQLNVPFIGPRMLRNTRVNWLLRRTGDPDLTAEMNQHAKETLIGTYHLASLQRAMVQSTRFWSQHDPHLKRTESVAPGGCTGTPQSEQEIPKAAPSPNCIRKSGCLWCNDHRDLDAFDYVWALTTFAHLKRHELTKTPQPQADEDVPPAQLVVNRIHEKLEWFEHSSDVRRAWLTEAQARIVEGAYHPNFQQEIAALEGLL